MKYIVIAVLGVEVAIKAITYIYSKNWIDIFLEGEKHNLISTILFKTVNNLQIEDKVPNTKDGKYFQNIINLALKEKWHQLSMGKLMSAIASQFLNASYQEGLLDKSHEETLFISLTQFDCVLFVETVLALARGIASQNYQYGTFVKHLVEQRYLNGHMNGYCSRLHYFSEWIVDNQKRGIVKDITPVLGGIQINKKLNFMSSHKRNYPQLVNNEANYRCIVEKEKNIDEIRHYYIPTHQIKSIYSHIKSGDIIGVTTNIAGLDTTHTGLVHQYADGNVGLIHASPIGKVTISRDLQRYIENVKNATGILVARPIPPQP